MIITNTVKYAISKGTLLISVKLFPGVDPDFELFWNVSPSKITAVHPWTTHGPLIDPDSWTMTHGL